MCDLSGFDEGSFTIGHTDERKAELVDSIRAILAEGVLSPKAAEVLRGRLHWFNSYLFGRAPCNAMHKRAQGHDHGNLLCDDLQSSLLTLLKHLETAPPLTIRLTSGRNLYVFTDGSYEPAFFEHLRIVQLLETIDELLNHELEQDCPQRKFEGAGILLFLLLLLPFQSGLIETRDDAVRSVGFDEYHVAILRGRDRQAVLVAQNQPGHCEH